ncbi:acyltransferase [Companilactobacillus sp. RD055328]|uniref:acyltransferase family protein n=1 Tax=Companilactobacillus sp. RD055328 TaxID=2916634 RepID=UPI001FC7DFE5|nr:acyltransferase [Companilactobacillus sp. RD055328]
MERNYDAIDLMKFVAAIFIIGIHTAAFTDFSPLLNTVFFQWVGRLALPLFFVSSGFLLSKKIQKHKESTREIVVSYAKKVSLLYIFWLVFNWKWVWDSWFANSENSFSNNIVHFIAEIIFQSTFNGSWYLASCIFSALLYFIVLKEYTIKTRVIVTAIIFLAVATFSLRLNNGMILFMKNVMYLPVSVFVGPIYFAIGDVIAHDTVENIKANISMYWLGLLAAVLLWGAELIVKKDILISTDQLYIYPILVYFIFSLVLVADIHIPYAYEMRKLSSIMYLSHFSFIFLNHGFLQSLHLPATVIFELTLIETIIFGILILKLRKVEEFKWIKYAY